MKRKKLYTETGEPKRVRCYMYKRVPKPFADYITVVFTYAGGAGYPHGYAQYITMSGEPCHPQGVCLWGEAYAHRFKPGGSRVKFSELPRDCQEVVRRYYREMWEEEA